MDYCPTTAEITIVSFLKSQPNFSAKYATLQQQFSDPNQAARAIEGCLAKQFVRENVVSGMVELTPAGKKLV